MGTFGQIRGLLGFGSAAERRSELVFVYRDADRICVPTTAKTKAGFFLDIEPVAVLGPDDVEGLATALANRMAAPMERVPTPPRDQPAILLQHTGYRRWTELERRMACWAIEPTSSGWKVVKYRRRAEGKGLEPEDTSLVELSGAPATVATAIAEMLTAAS